MRKNMRLSVIFILLLLCAAAYAYADSSDTLTITTYYPSPYGMYNEMRAKKMVVGDLALATTPSPAEGDLVVTGNVGVGSTSPQAKLDVRGGVMVGSDVTCNSNKSGTLRYNSGNMEFCDGNTWQLIFSTASTALPPGAMLAATSGACPNGYTVNALELYVDSMHGTQWYYCVKN